MSNHKDTTYIPLDDYINFYYTSDIAVATTLVVRGYELVSIDKPKPNARATFVFKRDLGMDELVDGFWADRIEVKPLQFMTALKTLKSRVYNA
tara:strand:- start:2883 stop:3161 length:279 start_codon:yes stop_codon:yes gene_type:complete